MAAVRLLIANNFSSEAVYRQAIAFQGDESADSYEVLSVSQEVAWDDLNVLGCDAPTSGPVVVGAEMTSCSDPVTVVYRPTNTVIRKTWRVPTSARSA